MAVDTGRRPPKNIWIAASDGDLDRVKYLIETEGMSPNAQDHHTYTPMHAAASYSHIHLLEYLISVGGDLNLTDSDGETPLFTVENKEVAEWLVQRGARLDFKNIYHMTAAEMLLEDYPDVAIYLQSLMPDTPNLNPPSPFDLVAPPSTTTDANQSQNHLIEPIPNNGSALPLNLTEDMTNTLLSRTEEIMRAAEETGEDPEEKLRAAVGDAVMDGLGQVQNGGEGVAGEAGAEERSSKRTRNEE